MSPGGIEISISYRMSITENMPVSSVTMAVRAAAERALAKIANNVRILAQEKAPKASGDLAKSIKVTRDTSGLSDIIQYSVGSDISYAGSVEYGSSPHFVPFSALQLWANQKGFSPANAVAGRVQQAIMLHGTQPHPYLRPAYIEATASANEVMLSHLQAVVSSGGGGLDDPA